MPAVVTPPTLPAGLSLRRGGRLDHGRSSAGLPSATITGLIGFGSVIDKISLVRMSGLVNFDRMCDEKV